jgi:exosortase F-associated protein
MILLNYFKSDFNVLPLPSYDSFHLLIGLLFRYVLNTVLSLGLLYTIFRDGTMIKFASSLRLFFLILVSLFLRHIHFYGAQSNLIFFYVRRFLIQPIL